MAAQDLVTHLLDSADPDDINPQAYLKRVPTHWVVYLSDPVWREDIRTNRDLMDYLSYNGYFVDNFDEAHLFLSKEAAEQALREYLAVMLDSGIYPENFYGVQEVSHFLKESADPDDVDPRRYLDAVPHKWAVVYEDPATVRQYLKAFTDEWSIGGRDATLFPSKEQADFALKRYIERYHAEDRPDTVEYYGVREMTDMLGEGVNPEVCLKCGGKCCSGYPGIYSPEDVGAPDMAAMQARIAALLRSDEAELDSWYGDPRTGQVTAECHTVWMLRPRTTRRPGAYEPCAQQGAEGCKLPYEQRPKQCRELEPNADATKCADNYSKRQAAIDWIPYQDVISAAREEGYRYESTDPDDIDPQRYIADVPAGYIISWTNADGVEWVYQNYNSFAGGSAARVNALVFPTYVAAQELLQARGLEGYDILPYTPRRRRVVEAADPDDPQALLNRMKGRWAVTTSVAGRPYYVKVITLTDRQRAKRAQIGKPDYRWLYDWVLDIKRASLFTSKDAAEAVLNRMQSANSTAGKYRSVQDVSNLLHEAADPDAISDPMDYMRKATIPSLVVSPYGLRKLLKDNGYQVISVYRTKQYDGLNATVWMREHTERDWEMAEEHAKVIVRRWVHEQFGSELPAGTYVLAHTEPSKGTMSIHIVYKGVNEAVDPDDIADPHSYIAGAVEPLEQITTKEIRLLMRSLGFKVSYARKTKKFPGISLFVQDATGRSLDWQDEKLVSNAIHEWLKKRLGNKPGTIRGYEYAHDYQINVWAWDGMETDVATGTPRRVRKPGLSIDIYKPAEGQSLYATHYLESADPDAINPQQYLDAVVKHHPVGAGVTSKRLDARYGKDKFLGQIKNMTSLGHPGHKFFNNLPAYYVEWHDYPSFNGSYPHDDLVVYYNPVGEGDYELGYEDNAYPDIDESADPDAINPKEYLDDVAPSLEHLMQQHGFEMGRNTDRYYKSYPLADGRFFIASVEDNGMQPKSSEPDAPVLQTYWVQVRTRDCPHDSFRNMNWTELAFAQADDDSLTGLVEFAEEMGQVFSEHPGEVTDSEMQSLFVDAGWDYTVRLGESLADPDDPDAFLKRHTAYMPKPHAKFMGNSSREATTKWTSLGNPAVVYSSDTHHYGTCYLSASDSGAAANATVDQLKQAFASVIRALDLKRVNFTVFQVDRDIDAIYGLEADGVIETTGQNGMIVYAIVEEPVQESVILEMGGAVNIWLSPAGKPYYCADHAEWAASEVLKKPLSKMTGTYWEARGYAYRQMFRRGWARLAIPHTQKKLMVDSHRTTPAQWEWIYDKGWEDRLQIVDDQEQTIIDYREGSGVEPPKGEETGTWEESLQVADPDDPDQNMRRALDVSDPQNIARRLTEAGYLLQGMQGGSDEQFYTKAIKRGVRVSVFLSEAFVTYGGMAGYAENQTDWGVAVTLNWARSTIGIVYPQPFRLMEAVAEMETLASTIRGIDLEHETERRLEAVIDGMRRRYMGDLAESADPDDPDQFIEQMPVPHYIVRGRDAAHHDWRYVNRGLFLTTDPSRATHYSISAAQQVVDRFQSRIGELEIVPMQESVDPDAPEHYVQSIGGDFGAWLEIQGLTKSSDAVVDDFAIEGYMEGAPRSLRVIHFKDGVDYRSNPRGPWMWCLLGTNKQGEGEEAQIRPVVERFLQRLKPTDDYTGSAEEEAAFDNVVRDEDMPVEEAMVEVLLTEAGPDEFDPELYLHQTTSAREALRMVGMSSIGKAWPKDTVNRVFKRYPLNPPVPYNRGSVKEPNMTTMEAVTVYDFAGRATVRGGIEMAAGILFSDGVHAPQVSMDIDPENMTAGLARVIHHLDRFFASYNTTGKDWETVLRDVVRELGAARHAQHGRRMREAIEPFKQPDEVTCGSSVVYMLSRAMGKLNADFQQVCQMCRTNRLWGTLPMFMSSALRKLGIAHTKTKVASAAQLDGVYALLTVYEHLPHWILVTGQLDGQFTVNDPAQGAVVYNAETIDALLDKSQLSGVYKMVGFMIGTAFRIECPVQESTDPDDPATFLKRYDWIGDLAAMGAKLEPYTNWQSGLYSGAGVWVKKWDEAMGFKVILAVIPDEDDAHLHYTRRYFSTQEMSLWWRFTPERVVEIFRQLSDEADAVVAGRSNTQLLDALALKLYRPMQKQWNESADPDDPDAYLRNYHPMELIVKAQVPDGPRYITRHSWEDTFKTKAAVERWLSEPAIRGHAIAEFMDRPYRVVLEEWVVPTHKLDAYLERVSQWVGGMFIDITDKYPCPFCGGEPEPVDSDVIHFRHCTRCERTWFLGKPERFGMSEAVDPDEPTPDSIIRLGRQGDCNEPCEVCGKLCTLNHYQSKAGLVPKYHICQGCDSACKSGLKGRIGPPQPA